MNISNEQAYSDGVTSMLDQVSEDFFGGREVIVFTPSTPENISLVTLGEAYWRGAEDAAEFINTNFAETVGVVHPQFENLY